MDADRSLDVHHVELEAGLDHLVVLEALVGEPLPGTEAQTVKSESFDAFRDLRVLRRQCTAFARRDVLRRVERVGREVAVRPDPPSAPRGADGVRGVLDDTNSVPIAECVEPVHVDRSTGEMDRHDRRRPWRDCGLRLIEVDQPGAGLAVDEDRRRPDVLDGIGGGDERHRGHDHLVAGADVQCPQCEHQGRRAGRDAANMRDADVLLEHALESLDLRARADPARTQRVGDLLDLRVAQERPSEDEECVAIWCLAGQAPSPDGIDAEVCKRTIGDRQRDPSGGTR